MPAAGAYARDTLVVDRPGTAVAPEGLPTLVELQARGATIGAVEVHVQNIFDLSDPRENRFLYRAANHLHYRTREATVREQLLFASGEPVNAQRLEETERILRGRQYLNDAWVVPVRYDAATNVVDVAVTVRDVWTLNPGFSFGRSGGANRTRFEIEEQNLLGTGVKISLGRAKNVDRTSTLFQLADSNLFGSWWQLGLQYEDNSDGRVHSADLQRPFYSLDTRRAFGVSAYDGMSIRSRYDRGVVVDQFEEARRDYGAYVGLSRGLVDGWTQRWYVGVRHERREFTRLAVPTLQPAVLPEDRELAYPWIGWQVVEDRYRKDENLDLIGRTEDVFLGRSAYVEIGWADHAFGGDRSALLARASALAGWELAPRQQLFVNAGVSGRIEDGTARNVVANAQGRWFYRLTEHQLLYAALTGTTTTRLDAERQLLLGGEEGLRGYPLRFQGGTSSALFTLEHRVFTDWYPFRLVRVGGAVFFDAGRTWGRSLVGTEPYGTLKDVGLGLRFGNNRSGLGNVLHVDFSYALDAVPGVKRFEVTVETRERF